MVPLDSNGLMTYSRHKTQSVLTFKIIKKQTVQHYFKWDESTLNKFFAAFHENIQITHETIQGKGFYNIYIERQENRKREKNP